MLHTTRVFLTLAPIALSFVRDRRRWIWWGPGLARTPEFHRARADRLVAAIVRLGPTFVKIAQVFASRADLIPEPYLAALGSLVDQVPALPFDRVDAAILDAYGRRADDIFDQFERTPVAAASLAQVHRARVDGRTVAVKVLRPGIEERLEADIRAARTILELLDRWWGHPHIKRELTALAAFTTRAREEVDFRLEAGYAKTIRANFANNDRVVIPEILEEYTRQRVLVMEFIEGTRADRLDPSRVDVRAMAQTLVELYVQMELIDGVFHADPHPGNVFVLDDGRIGLVDFGAVVHVPIAMRRALVHTSIAAIRRDAAAVTDGFFKMGLFGETTDRASVRWIAELMIEGAYSRTTTKERLDMLLARRVMRSLFDSPIQLTEEAVYFARAAALIEGIGTRYDPYFQIVPIASPVVLRMRTRILRSLGEDVTPSPEEIAAVTGYALGRATKWIRERVANAQDAWEKRRALARTGTGPALGLMLMAMLACSRPTISTVSTAATPAPRSTVAGPTAIDVRCDSCGPIAMRPEIVRALSARAAALQALGGACAEYGATMERALTNGLITIRPFMWRVDDSLASARGHDTGEMHIAAEIDSLNPGVRTVDDIVHSVEYEAAHITFRLLSRQAESEALVERHLSGCRGRR